MTQQFMTPTFPTTTWSPLRQTFWTESPWGPLPSPQLLSAAVHCTGARPGLRACADQVSPCGQAPLSYLHREAWCFVREQWGDTQLNSSYCFKVETVGFSVTCEGKIQRGLQDFSSEQVKELSFRLHTWRKIWEKDICVEIRKWDFEHVKCAMPIGHLNENVNVES